MLCALETSAAGQEIAVAGSEHREARICKWQRSNNSDAEESYAGRKNVSGDNYDHAEAKIDSNQEQTISLFRCGFTMSTCSPVKKGCSLPLTVTRRTGCSRSVLT